MKYGKHAGALLKNAFATMLAAALACTMLPSAALATTSTDVGGGVHCN